MCRFTLITFSFLFCERVLALSVDQRQTGDMNVQIDLKNINVFALTKGKEEYVDYDYAYDYSEMTIKPQNGTTTTTIKPLNTTETVVQIDKNNATKIPAEFEITTKIVEMNESSTTEKVATETVIAANTSSSTAATSTTIVLLASTERPETSIMAKNQTAISDCKKGFFRNDKGNCEIKLQNPSNILLKMLQQKSKSTVGNGARKS